MTHRHPDDSQLDRAIDRAVREMMSVEPRADLRQRVLAELTAESVRASLWPRLAFAAAALAMLVIIVFMSANRPADPAADQTTVLSTPPAAAPGHTGAATKPREAIAPKIAGRAPGVVNSPQIRPSRRSPAMPAADERRVQAASIDTAEPIAIELIAPVERLTPIDPISITPITIEPIAITPLRPPR